jgi:hypothetical protein
MDESMSSFKYPRDNNQSDEDLINGNAQEFLYVVFEDAIMAAAEGTKEEKEIAVEWLTNGNGRMTYEKSGYQCDYQMVLDWIECGCQTTPVHVLLLQSLHGGRMPIRKYIPPCEDEDDILYDYKRC